MDIAFIASSTQPGPHDALVLFAHEGDGLDALVAAQPAGLREGLTRALAAGRFRAAKGQVLDLVSPAGSDAARMVVAGVGPAGGEDRLSRLEQAAAAAFNAVKASGATRVVLAADDAASAAHAAFGARLAAYRFDRYRTTEKADAKPSVTSIAVASPDPAAAETAFAPLRALAEGVCFTRDLVSEPANVLYPEEFARRVKALEPMGLQVEILGEAEMEKLGMRLLLSVGEGSARESQLAVIRWNGAADPDAQPIAFIGKGVCFDTGGISIKPADGMEDMKWDMGGAGAVAGLMHTLAGRKAKVNAVGILGLVENMPDGKATRPGDVVASMSGQTVEIINTDAEGRLVLGDALWYCQERFKPQFMIDLATLTGAIIISLGHDYAGLFSNDDALSEKLLAASRASGDNLWRLPMPGAYEKQFDSKIADMMNVGGRPAGSITAALILQKFVNGVPWAHLDIASVAWRKSGSVATIPEGASGFGVRLLNQLVADSYEG